MKENHSLGGSMAVTQLVRYVYPGLAMFGIWLFLAPQAALRAVEQVSIPFALVLSLAAGVFVYLAYRAWFAEWLRPVRGAFAARLEELDENLTREHSPQDVKRLFRLFHLPTAIRGELEMGATEMHLLYLTGLVLIFPSALVILGMAATPGPDSQLASVGVLLTHPLFLKSTLLLLIGSAAVASARRQDREQEEFEALLLEHEKERVGELVRRMKGMSSIANTQASEPTKAKKVKVSGRSA